MCLYELNCCGYKTWASNIEEILCESNLEILWNRQLCNAFIIKHIDTYLHKEYSKYWVENICDTEKNPKLRTYCVFKSNFYYESYLDIVKDFKIRRTLTRFRLSNHVLAIEKGRHSKPKIPVEERLCNYCSMNCIEDEYHFLCVCPAYETLRQEFIQNCNSAGFYGLQSNFTLQNVLNLKEMSFYTGKLINNMFLKRSSIVNCQ